MPCKYTSSPGPAGIECINPLMHVGPVKLDSARFSWERDISVSTEFRTTLLDSLSARNRSFLGRHRDRTVKRCCSRGRLTSIDRRSRSTKRALIQKFTIIRGPVDLANHAFTTRGRRVIVATRARGYSTLELASSPRCQFNLMGSTFTLVNSRLINQLTSAGH